ncbi:glucosaminidase domain-containing protein [Idiomarina loihiensis]|uniref:glucosaminidase domain-containing protein n=1 Tax=Idiomarina loihiensis TaxID=135577 RepID=UPI00129C6D1D|nr:glucosaminidase domain-containing protein [Idiomarina loihiensis]MRJ43944.1 peptidoglycan hydrolase [Idiomarina loihiensis]UTW33925.1 glucosaminidase domain-containing protein [Idiomarina loihiensis]
MRLLTILLFIVLSVAALLLPWLIKDTEVETPEQSVTAHLPAIPEVPVQRDLPDFMSITDVTEKKEEFFRFLLPLVEAENIRILHDRAYLKAIHERFKSNELTEADKKRIADWIEYYRLEDDIAIDENLFGLLKRRIDIIPEMMVLVQAANESGWGTSRFSRQGLNLFGQWCYSKGCGLVPNQRDDDGRHEVAQFDSVNASVKSYMRNINTHGAYLDLRLLREQKRLDNEDILARDLITGLSSYSERGEEYIDELRAMIRINRPIVKRVSEELNTPEVPQPE